MESQSATDFPLRQRVGALVVCEGHEVIGGYNYRVTLPDDFGLYSIHAEHSALTGLEEFIVMWGMASEPYHMFVYREVASGIPSTSRPCKHCLYRLTTSRLIATVTFIDEHGNMVKKNL